MAQPGRAPPAPSPEGWEYVAIDFIGVLEFGVVAFTSIVAVMNPVSTAAVYTALTEAMREDDRRRVIRESIRISAMVLLFFALTGQVIFLIFGLTLPAFKIAGGLLLMSIATGMLYPKKIEYSPEELENIAVVPLAFPLTCGAGTITTVILLASEAGGAGGMAMVFTAVAAALGISYLLMTYAPEIFAFIGEQEVRIIVRLLSVFVLAIAVQFLISGISEAMPQILANVPLPDAR